MAQLRGELLRRARSYFADQSVLEVDVPALHSCTTTDPNIRSIRVTNVEIGTFLAFIKKNQRHAKTAAKMRNV